MRLSGTFWLSIIAVPPEARDLYAGPFRVAFHGTEAEAQADVAEWIADEWGAESFTFETAVATWWERRGLLAGVVPCDSGV